MIKKTSLTNFAVFRENNIEFSPNINIFIGKNSTGKSILLKLLYSTIWTLNKYEGQSRENLSYELSKKLKNVFLINKVGRLTTRKPGVGKTSLNITFMNQNKVEDYLELFFTTKNEKLEILKTTKFKPASCVFIPTKEIISMMDKGIIGLYERFQFIEEIYYDLAVKLDKPLEKGTYDRITKDLLLVMGLKDLEKIQRKDKEFYAYIKGIGNLESKLVAEGYRKLMTVLYLIKNGELTEGTYLFWDEPEVNLNPSLMKVVVDVLIFLAQKLNIQIFIATHDYFLIKYFDLKHKERKNFNLRFFCFNQTQENIEIESSTDLYDLQNNPIMEEFRNIYEYDLRASLILE